MVAVMSFYWFMAGEVAPSYILHYAALALFHLTNMPSLWLKNDWGPFGNVWSLAVEEQFYLWWSLSLPFLLRVPVKIRNVVILTTIGVSFGLRIYTGLNQGSLFGLNPYLSAPTNFGKMLVGASLRLLPLPPIVKARKFAWFGFLGFFVSLCYVALLGYHPNETATHIWQSLGWVESASDLSAVFCTTLFLTGIQESGFWLLEGQSIRFLGRISYAGYLWQIPLLKRTGWNRDYTGWSTTALSLVIATISTFWIEEPLRRQYAKYKKSKVSLLDHTSSESFLPLDTGHSES
jgi:peptidoglycan/LPS O-acetylase OafA/YrhL